MKKIVLSAIALSALCSSAMAEAVAPTLKISGNTIMNAYAVNQKVKFNGKGRAHHFANDISDLYFLVSGRTAAGIEYKYKVNFQAFSNENPVINQNYVEFNTRGGTIQFGNVVGPEDSMVEDGGSIVGGTGTFDGAYYKVYNLSAFSMRGNDNVGDTGYATKIVYYTPELWDFRAGVAYTPDTTHLGDARLNNNIIKGNPHVPGVRTFLPELPAGSSIIGLRNWAFGLSYKKELGHWGINVNGAYINDMSFFSAQKLSGKVRVRNTSAYQLGAIVGYRLTNGNLVQVGAGWLDNGHSRLQRVPLFFTGGAATASTNITSGTVNTGNMHLGNSGHAFNAAAGYTMGAYKFAVSYQNSERRTDETQKAHTEVYSATADMVPVAGLKFYGEVDYIRTKSNDAAVTVDQNFRDAFHTSNNPQDLANRRNQGTVVIAGTKISF